MKHPNTFDNTACLPRELASGRRTHCKLPGGGSLLLEHDIPYLMVYRKRKKDKKTQRLAKTAASYLIFSNANKHDMDEFLEQVLERMSKRFRSYLIIEINEGALESTEFVISAPYKKLTPTVDTLSQGLAKIAARYGSELNCRVVDTTGKSFGKTSFVTDIDQLRSKGGTWIGLQVPPAYRDGEGTEFPVYFRKFRTQFAKIVQEAMFEFIRVQTPSKMASYHGLGKRNIHDEVLKIDKRIADIQNSYSFLLLVAPINISELRTRYFEDGFKNIGTYHYRLLPIDPDILKRKLYNLDIHEIDDPALAYIYYEKREEIDQELTMLKERGSKHFFLSSIRMYGDVSEALLQEALAILRHIPEEASEPSQKLMNVNDFKALAEREFEFFRKMAPDFESKVHIRKDVNIMMVAKGELYLPSEYTLTDTEARALIQHEIGTHALTYYNGSRQPLRLMANGLTGYDPLQEGIAVMAEYLADALGANRLRILAGRVVAGHALRNGADFDELFHLLFDTYGFSKHRAFNITSRMFQGGGFQKDIVYLKGLLELREHLAEGHALEPLLAGKFALRHLPIVKDLMERELLFPPKLKPRYLMHTHCDKKLTEFKNGMPLFKMVR